MQDNKTEHHLCGAFADKRAQFRTATSELLNATVSDEVTP